MELDDSSATEHADLLDDELALRHARNELKRAAQLAVAGELVASITHDLRQPLTAVEMNVSAAIHFLRQRTPSVDDAVEALDDALKQQQRMREALQVLQDLAVRREPHWEGFDLVAVVHEVVTLVGTDALVRHVPVEVEIDDAVPAVVGDATLVRQALLNVVLDALEATSVSGRPLGPVRITVRRMGDAAEVAVSHLGARADPGGAAEWGLALARSVAAAHGATLAITGTVTTGITVTIRWPTRRPARQASEPRDA